MASVRTQVVDLLSNELKRSTGLPLQVAPVILLIRMSLSLTSLMKTYFEIGNI